MKRILCQQPLDQTDSIACRLYPSLSFFFDGTNNNMERDKPLNKHSNVAKLYQAALVPMQDAKAVYIPGVGTPFKFLKVVGYTDHLKDDEGGMLGLGLGTGGDMRIKFALGEFSRRLGARLMETHARSHSGNFWLFAWSNRGTLLCSPIRDAEVREGRK